MCAVSPGDSSALPGSCGEDTPPPPRSFCLFGGIFGSGVWDLPQQGIKPVPPAWVAHSLKRWTAREVLPMVLKGGFPQLASTTSSLSHLQSVALPCPTSL